MDYNDYPEDIREQLIEMDIHKWIESEKACRDLGKMAYLDWIERYAEKWREKYEERKKSD